MSYPTVFSPVSLGVYDPNNTHIWQTTPPHIGAINNGPAKIRRMTLIEKKLKEANSRTRSSGIWMTDSMEFRVLDADAAVEIFGGINPVYAGRPKPWVMGMLNAVPSPVTPRSKTASGHYFRGSFAGLYFVHDSIPGKRRKRFRLSGAGLKVLDHWNGKHKSFRPFYDAYVSRKATKEIVTLHCDMVLGVKPAFIDETKEKQKQALAAIAIEELKREKERQRILLEQSEFYRKTAQPGWGEYQLRLEELQRRMVQGTAVPNGWVGDSTSALDPRWSLLGGLFGGK